MEKHSESRLSYLFAHLHLLSSDLFSSDSSHLCFSTVHIVGSIASKLPSIINHRVKPLIRQLNAIQRGPHPYHPPKKIQDSWKPLKSWIEVCQCPSTPFSDVIQSLLPITQTPPNKKNRICDDWCGTSVVFWLGTIGFLIVVIENQKENRIVKQWVQPPIN